MKRHTPIFFVIALLVSLTACGGQTDTPGQRGQAKAKNETKAKADKSHQPTVSLVSTIKKADVDKAIELAAGYMKRHVRKNGQFVYETHPNPAVPIVPEYNILRHCGTLYALAHYHIHAKGDLSVLVKGTGFVIRDCLSPLSDEHPKLLAIWSHPEITLVGRPLQAKLGGAGLALIAFSTIDKVKPGAVPIHKCQQVAEFIMHMQKKDGSYFSVYYPFSGGKSALWTSLYYPGEAALGLLLLHHRDKDQRWLDTAARTVNFLVTSQEKKKEVLKDHWILLTLERYLPLHDKVTKKDQIDRQRILQHAQRTLTMFLDEQEPQDGHKDYDGSFTSDGLTNPAATRLEGMLAALNFVPESETELRQRLSNSIQKGIRFLLRSQYDKGRLRGGWPRAIKPLKPGHEYYSITFNRIAPSVRIDNVQHAMSALLRFREVYYP